MKKINNNFQKGSVSPIVVAIIVLVVAVIALIAIKSKPVTNSGNTPQTVITMLSPNGREVMTAGLSRPISFDVAGEINPNHFVKVTLEPGGTQIALVGATTTSYNLAIPLRVCIAGTCKDIAAGTYKLRVSLYDGRPCVTCTTGTSTAKLLGFDDTDGEITIRRDALIGATPSVSPKPTASTTPPRPSPFVPTTATGTPQSSSAPVTSWKPYTSAEYGFNLQYPGNAQLTETVITGGKNITFTLVPQNNKSVSINILNQTTCTDTAAGSDLTKTTINSVEFIKYDYSKFVSGASPANATIFCIVKNGRTFKIMPKVIYSGASVDATKDPVLSQIVSSFAFIN